MITLLVVVCGYGWAAWRTAKVWARREFARHLRAYPSIADEESRATWRNESMAFGFLVGLVWPFYWVWRWISRDMYSLIPPPDAELRMMLAERDARIARLEREAGI